MLWLLAMAAMAAFTALVMVRSTPLRLSAGSSEVVHRLPDGVTITLAPGSAVEVVREFSLWGGSTAHVRLMRWKQGRGEIQLAPEAHPFFVETRDAQLEVNDGHFALSYDVEQGTEVKMFDGRVLVIAKESEAVGAIRMPGNRTLAERGETITAKDGALELTSDVASEAPSRGCGTGTCAN
jgi:ferric-dicitrate binding protein FerR (iron transport regulator)